MTPSHPERVLIMKPSALGDVVTALPVLRGLRRAFPNAQIDWLLATGCAPLLEGDPDLNRIVLFERKRLGQAWRSADAARALFRFCRDLRRARYDWVLDLQGLLRSGLFTAFTRATVRAGFADAREGAPRFYTHRIPVTAAHTVDRNIELARALGVETFPADMRLSVSDTARQAIRARLAEDGIEPTTFLLCVPPTRWVTKTYPVRHWRRVVAELAKDVPVLLSGSPAEEERSMCEAVADGQPNVYNWAGKTTVPELAALIEASAGVVGGDSATKFLAPAVGVDCVTLIGPTQVARTGPYLRGQAIVADVPCQGCLQKRCEHTTCMESIPPETVIAAARQMLEPSATCQS